MKADFLPLMDRAGPKPNAPNSPQVLESLVAVVLTRHRRRHPGVEVHLVEDGGINLRTRLDRGDVQLTIMSAGDERSPSRLLYPIYCLAILPSTHRLGRQARLEVSKLADEPVLVLRHGFGSREWFETACRAADFRPRILLESGAPHTLVALARAGYGIAVIPSPVQFDRAGVRAVTLVRDGAPLGTWSTIAWDPRRFRAPYVERFVEELVAYCRHSYPGRDLTRHAPPLPRPKK